MNNSYLEKAEQMLLNVKEQMLKNPSYMGNWIDLMIQNIQTPYEICLLGDKVQNQLSELNAMYLPNVIVAGGTDSKIPLMENKYSSGSTIVYVCQHNICKKPVNSIKEALESILN